MEREGHQAGRNIGSVQYSFVLYSHPAFCQQDCFSERFLLCILCKACIVFIPCMA